MSIARKCHGRPGVLTNVYGAAAEKLVTATLLKMGLNVWQPSFEGGRHDLFFEAEGRGWTVQVRMGRVHSTGNIEVRRAGVASDIVAAVWLPDNRIRWVPCTSDGLPGVLNAAI